MYPFVAAIAGYYPKFLLQQRELQARLPGVAVTSAVGRVGAFEVTVDGKLAYSKLRTGTFPDFAGTASAVAEYGKTGTVPPSWK